MEKKENKETPKKETLQGKGNLAKYGAQQLHETLNNSGNVSSRFEDAAQLDENDAYKNGTNESTKHSPVLKRSSADTPLSPCGHEDQSNNKRNTINPRSFELSNHELQLLKLAKNSAAKYEKELAESNPVAIFLRDLSEQKLFNIESLTPSVPYYGLRNIAIHPEVQPFFGFIVSDSLNDYIQKPKLFAEFLTFVTDHAKNKLGLESFGPYTWNKDFISRLLKNFIDTVGPNKIRESWFAGSFKVSPPIEETFSYKLTTAQAELLSKDGNIAFKPLLDTIDMATQGNRKMDQTVKCLRYLSVKNCGVVHGVLIRGILEFTCYEFASRTDIALPRDFNWMPLAKKIQEIAHQCILSGTVDEETAEGFHHASNSSNVAVNLLNEFVHKNTLPVAKDLIYPLDFTANFVSLVWPKINK